VNVLSSRIWQAEDLLEFRYIGGSWEEWRCRLCGAVRQRHFDEEVDEYRVHGNLEAAWRCMDRWKRARQHRR
jgi:hypothetical protein